MALTVDGTITTNQVDIQVLEFSTKGIESRKVPLTAKQQAAQAAGLPVTYEYENVETALPYGHYRVKIRFPGSGDNTFNTTWAAVEDATLGDNFRNVIAVLDLDKGGTLPGSLSIMGWMKYSSDYSYESGIRVLKMELTTETYKLIISQNWSGSRGIGNYGTVDDMGYAVHYDYKPNYGTSDKYFKGTVVSVTDGDTIKVLIDETHNVAEAPLGSAIRVRLVGVLCPEIEKDYSETWFAQNEEWAASHGLEPPTDENGLMKDICALAEEGRVFMENILLNKRVIVEPEMEDYIDVYGRIIGLVYTDQPMDYVGISDTAIVVCANTSLIVNMSKVMPEFALAEPTVEYSINDRGVVESKFPIATWWSLMPNYKERLAEIEAKEVARANSTGKQAFLDKYGLKIVTTIDNKEEVVYNEEGSLWEEDKLNNANDVPADSQFEDYENMVVDDRNKLDKGMGIDPNSPFHLRIGDSTFLVPPLSIRFDALASNQRVQTLRSKSSIQVGNGHSSTQVTIELFFPNLASVNGYESRGPNGTTYYRNGLRPLIAQFKRAPFLPIENELINERFKIYAVALKDLEINTVPGFPGCIQAKLTLLEFDHTVYMPAEEDFASAFCWPLYRWYYQRAMQPQKDPAKTELKKIATLDNSISFKIPDEGILNERRQAINDLNNKLHPQLYKQANVQEGTTMGEMIRESNEVETAQRQYEGFKEAITKYDQSVCPLLYNSQGVFDTSTLSKNDIPSNQRALYLEALMTIVSSTYYDGSDITGVSYVYFVMNTIGYVLNLIRDLAKEINITSYGSDGYSGWDLLVDINALGTTPGLFFTWERDRELRAFNRNFTDAQYFSMTMQQWADDVRLDDMPNLKNIGYLVDYHINDGIIFSQGGIFVIEIKSSNASKIGGRMGITQYHAINPADTAMISLLTNSGENTELSFVDYELKFEDLNLKAHMSEADIPEVDFPINDIYIQSVTAAMHNTYAPLQLSSRETPSYQHLGSSDAVVEMVIRTKSRDAVERFRQLMSTAQRLSRDYRVAITSGVVSIDTPIMQLLGTRSILIERLSVETSKEDKESFIISITLVAFDKTQRMREELDMVSAFGGTGEEIENAFYAYSKRRRNESGFEYSLVDFALRDLEVYPDLDLPTFKELNRDLPSLGITYPNGVPFTKYPNPDHAKFVDPDFYIRCEHTFRDYIYAVLEDGEVPIYMKDRLGFEEFEVTPTAEDTKTGMLSTSNIYSDETIQWVNTNLGEVYVGERKGSTAGWAQVTDTTGIEKSYYTPKTSKTTTATGIIKANVGSFAAGVSQEILNAITEEAVSESPTSAEIARWNDVSFTNPTPNEFVSYLNTLVCDEFFRNLPSDAELIKAGEINVDTYKYGTTRVSAPKITKEKVVNVLKALYDHESGWKQFDPDGTVSWNSTNDIGIGQLNAKTSDILQSLSMARQAAWDWKFNLRKGVEFFAQLYNFCINYGVKYGNPDAAVNPLDWAIVCYNRGPETGVKKFTEPQEVNYYNTIMGIFKNKYGADPLYLRATPTSTLDTSVDAVVKPEIGIEQAMGTYRSPSLGATPTSDWERRGQEMAQAILNSAADQTYAGQLDDKLYKMIPIITGGSPSGSLTTENVLAVDLFGEYDKSMDYWLNESSVPGMTNGQALAQYQGRGVRATARIACLVQNVILPKIRDGSFNPKRHYLLLAEGAAEACQAPATLDDLYKVDYTRVFAIRDKDVNAAEDVQRVEVTKSVAPLLSAPENVAILYRKSLSDILEYDARGRLIRAFPTYQMFIIDEGRWMAWHKLWDNFYGYNSILSIDLCKDRRIAADTAVISMTNVYYNLSTHDNEVSYGEWDYTLGDLIWGSSGPNGTRSKVWKTIWDLPDSDILLARRDELNTMMLKPGARIHLRLGYGANAYRLPVAFNGVLTEMNTGEIITIMAQGDGVELCNKLRVSPGDSNIDGILFKDVVEPRDFMGQMFTSKGTFMQNMINKVSGGVFYNSNPLGIVHFGVTEMPTATLLRGLDLFDTFEDYGECAQNIYCSAGKNTMSQWIYTEGVKSGRNIGFGWNWSDIRSAGQGGDEPNIKISLFDQTPWSVMQTLAHSCPDYIATVLPFEFRSTAFYGKPWWGVIDRYGYKYFYDTEHDMFIREPSSVTKKTFSQMRIYTDHFDIIGNNIKATDEYMYTNVIGMYDEGKKKTVPVMADSDIYPEKQKTAIVHLQNESDFWFKDTWTQSRYAQAAATSALRDYIKDMYQGELVVLGDPTAKPYDRMYLHDNHSNMSGMAEIKRVVHHFSLETGFISSITPDCIAIIDDREGIAINTWLAGVAIGTIGFTIGLLAKNILWKKMWTSPVAAAFRKWGKGAYGKLFTEVIAKMSHATEAEQVALRSISEDILEYFRKLTGSSTRSVDITAVRKELGTLLRKNKIYSAVDDAVLSNISKVFKKTAEVVKTKGGVGKAIDSLWDATKILKGGKLLSQSTGFAAKTVNRLWSGTTRLAKFGAKVGGNTAAAAIRATGAVTARAAAAVGTGGVSLLAEIALDVVFTIISATVVEKYQKWLKSRQALTIMPLKYKGSSFVAGINGHKGLIAGEEASAWDKFLMGSGFGSGAVQLVYGMFGVTAPDYEVSESEAQDTYMSD